MNKNLIHKFLKADFSKSFLSKNIQIFFKFLYFIKQGIFQKYHLQRAAGMAYSSLFAMVPTFVVFISILSSINFVPSDLKLKTETWIFTNFIPETSQKLSEQLASYMLTFKNSAATIGFIGGILMVFSVFSLLSTIENTFNSIMNVTEKRNFFHRLFAYTFLMVWSPILLGLSFVVKTDFMLTFTFLAPINAFYHYFLIICAFTLGYKIIPNKFISLKDAALGGFFATILWILANKIFTHYVSKLVNFDKFYGALGAIPLFLIWLYMVWIVVLIGMEITFVSQNLNVLDSLFRPLKGSDSWALKILLLIGKKYMLGKNFETEKSLDSKLDISSSQLHDILKVLYENDIIVKLPNDNLILSKPPEHIVLFKVVKLFFPSIDCENDGNNYYVRYIPLNLDFPSKIASMNLKTFLEEN